MPRKPREAKADAEGGKSKELKIVSVQVITREKVVGNPRQMALLYLIDRLGPIYEKTLQHLAYEIQQKGAQLGYNFKVVAGVPYSPEFKNDLIALSYVGFIEFNPSKKLQTTSEGKDALEKHGAPKGVVEVVEKYFDEIRNQASMLDWKVEEGIRSLKRLRGQGGRRPFGIRI